MAWWGEMGCGARWLWWRVFTVCGCDAASHITLLSQLYGMFDRVHTLYALGGDAVAGGGVAAVLRAIAP